MEVPCTCHYPVQEHHGYRPLGVCQNNGGTLRSAGIRRRERGDDDRGAAKSSEKYPKYKNRKSGKSVGLEHTYYYHRKEIYDGDL